MYLLELLRKEVHDEETERLIDELQNRLDDLAVERKENEVMDKGKKERLEAKGWRFGTADEFLGAESSDPPNLFNYPGGHSPS